MMVAPPARLICDGSRGDVEARARQRRQLRAAAFRRPVAAGVAASSDTRPSAAPHSVSMLSTGHHRAAWA